MRNKIAKILWLLSTATIIRSEDSTITMDKENIGSLFIQHEQYSYMCLKEPLSCVTQLTNSQLEQIYYMLENWITNVKLKYKNTTNKILVLGNSGAGVSTLVKFLAENEGTLISEEAGIDTEEYLISDGNKIGSSEIKSPTYVEEVLLSADTSIIDVPGFSQSRSIEEEIFVIHNIDSYLRDLNNLYHNICIKTVILAEYFSVQHGMNKENFINLLKNVYNNYENIDEKNIILIVTKVPNKYGMKRSVIADKNIVINTADFIKNIRIDLKKKLGNASCEENYFFTFAVETIDVLLETDDDENYTRINIFRQPDKQGALTDIKSAQENKRSLINFLNLHKNGCPTIRNTMPIYFMNLPAPPISKKASPNYEKFKTCIQEKVNSNIQDNYKKLKNLVPQHNVSEESIFYPRFSYDETYSELARLSREIKDMYKLKYRLQ